MTLIRDIHHKARRCLPLFGVLFVFGCARASAKPATKSEALDACHRGCFGSAVKRLSDEHSAKLFCSEMCGCLITHRFDSAGKQTKSSREELARQMSECAERGNAKLEKQK